MIAQNEVSALVHQTDTTLGQIEYAQSQLALLANLDPDDPTLPRFAETIEGYIGSRLLDAPTILHRNLKPGIALADDVFKATSRAVAANTRVFDKGKQAQVEAIYDYFAVYQTQLAILLANYWHAKPDTYSQETIRQNIVQIQRNVTEQRTSLKPFPPDNTWVDPATGLMWSFTRGSVSGTAFVDNYYTPTAFSITNPATGLVLPNGAPFKNWRLSTRDELTRHTSYINGNARVYLDAQLADRDAVPNWTWTFDSAIGGQRRAFPNRSGTPIKNYVFLAVFNLDSKQFEYLNDLATRYDGYTPPYAWPDTELSAPRVGSGWRPRAPRVCSTSAGRPAARTTGGGPRAPADSGAPARRAELSRPTRRCAVGRRRASGGSARRSPEEVLPPGPRPACKPRETNPPFLRACRWRSSAPASAPRCGSSGACRAGRTRTCRPRPCACPIGRGERDASRRDREKLVLRQMLVRWRATTRADDAVEREQQTTRLLARDEERVHVARSPERPARLAQRNMNRTAGELVDARQLLLG